MSTKGRDANQYREVDLGGDVSKARLDVCRLSEGRVERIANTTEAIAAQLTLGENAALVVDEFIYDPFRSRGAILVRVIKGTFLFVRGRIEGHCQVRPV
jgi:hypothetical protein